VHPAPRLTICEPVSSPTGAVGCVRCQTPAQMRVLLLTVVLLAAFASPASAGTHTWIGGNVGANWSVAGNWTGGVPTSGEAGGTIVRFTGTSSSLMNISNLTIDRLEISGNQNIVGGNSSALKVSGATLGANITSSGNDNQLDGTLPIQIVGTDPVFVGSTGAASVSLIINSPVSGAADASVNFFNTSSAPGAILNGNNTFAGTMNVNSGTVTLGNNAIDKAFQGQQIAVRSTGTLRLGQTAEIADTSSVLVDAGGTFNVNGKTEAIKNLTNSGTVDLAGGTLMLAGALTNNDGTVTLGNNGRLNLDAATLSGGTISGPGTSLVTISGDVSATSSSIGTANVTGPVALAGTRTITTSDGPQEPELIFNLAVSDSSGPIGALRKAGPGTVRLATDKGDAYTGGTTILGGVLEAQLKGKLTVGDGVGALSSAVYHPLDDVLSASTAEVTVLGDGLWDLAFFASVKKLAVAGGTIRTTTAGATGVSTPALDISGGAINGPGVLTTGPITAAGTSVIDTAAVSIRENVNEVKAAAGASLTITSAIAPAPFVSGALDLSGDGTVRLTGAITAPSISVDRGTLDLDATQSGSVDVLPGATLTGSGTAGSVSIDGTLRPDAPALKTGALNFQSNGRLAVAIPATGPTPSVAVNGTVVIDAAATLALSLAPGAILVDDAPHALISNDDADAINGAFAGVPEGAELTAGGRTFALTYLGDGNDLVARAKALPVVPPSPVAPGGSGGSGAAPAGPSQPAQDRVAPKLSLTIARNQKLSKTGTFKAKLRCDEACTVVLTTSATPARGKAKKTTKTVRLKARQTATVTLSIAKAARSRKKPKVSVVAIARDTAGNAAKAVAVKPALRR
jgi:autotransporter-associated beta strand protein